MLYITDRALDALAMLLDGSDATDDEGVLLYRDDEGEIAFALAEADEGDHVIEVEGQVLVIVSPDLVEALDGMALDFVDDVEEGAGAFTVGPVELDPDAVISPDGASDPASGLILPPSLN